MVPEEGIEPSLPCENRILNPARLPIPPLRQPMKRRSIAFGVLAAQCVAGSAGAVLGIIVNSIGRAPC